MFAEESGASALSDAQVVAQLETVAMMLMEHEPAGARVATLVLFSSQIASAAKPVQLIYATCGHATVPKGWR